MPDAIDIQGILKRLPHRYPFLLVDRILELEPGRRIVGLKNVSINEPIFAGHFPGHRVTTLCSWIWARSSNCKLQKWGTNERVAIWSDEDSRVCYRRLVNARRGIVDSR